jgi:hypothetical protein
MTDSEAEELGPGSANHVNMAGTARRIAVTNEEKP